MHATWKKKDTSVLFAAGQVDSLTLWSRIHNRLLELKDRRRRTIRDRIAVKGGVAKDVDYVFNERLNKKHAVVKNFTEQYIEDLLVQNCFKQPELASLVQILLPKQALEPYRNVRNYGILLDLEQIFGDHTHIHKEMKNMMAQNK